MRAWDPGGETRLAAGVMRRIPIDVAYDGGGFHGWQIQPGLPTIQGTLEQVLAEIEGGPVNVAGSGTYRCGGCTRWRRWPPSASPIPIPPENLLRAMNRLLPRRPSACSAACETHPEFHPRFDAKAKTYEYRIVRTAVCSPFEWPYVHHHPYPLDERRAAALAAAFTGEHDFTAFAASDTIATPKVNPRSGPSSRPPWNRPMAA